MYLPMIAWGGTLAKNNYACFSCMYFKEIGLATLIFLITILNFLLIFLVFLMTYFDIGSYEIPYFTSFLFLMVVAALLRKRMRFTPGSSIVFFFESNFPFLIIVLFFGVLTITGFLISTNLGFKVFANGGSISYWYLLLVPFYVLPVALPVWWADILRKQGYDFKDF